MGKKIFEVIWVDFNDRKHRSNVKADSEREAIETVRRVRKTFDMVVRIRVLQSARFQTIDVTKQVGNALEKAGFGSDSNTATDIKKAGIWDLMDALSGKDNSKFSKFEALKESKRRGL